ncbi:DNA polymerase [Mobiluncus curtisii]|uniref:DNA-directed DNA polymerase n=1 Tax=Mobiluncus curtisii ATCC 51333 TaxID=887326 RepID=E6LY33_9ACTO|nr:DNA polymerase [Mobiluncus curtisii]EFU80550.1 putative DNA-directed DNA polymerase [Mobiluncus curtisii ATCC 51333]
MRTLSIDIETYSPVILAKAGVYKYCNHPDFKILLFSYAIDSCTVRTVDLASGEQLPDAVLDALADSAVTKWAYNASFERTCLSAYLGRLLDPAGWRCSMVWAATLGLPLSLKDVGKVLNLDAQKMDEGKDLIKHFCVPDDNSQRRLPSSDPAGWKLFKMYNARDVEVETAIRQKLADFPVPDYLWEQYEVDQRINDRGIRIDTTLAANAIAIDEEHRAQALARAHKLTGLDNPASPLQLQEWLNQHGCPIESMAKESVDDALANATGQVREALELRQELSRSSVAKYRKMIDVTCTDQRAHGLLQFYGANRTGRWAGRLVQVQNLPRNYLPDLTQARGLVRDGNGETLEMLYSSVPDTLSQLIRTAFIPSGAHRFIVADYSAIEARVLAWLAGEETTLAAFKNGEDLYCATASAMFGVPVEKHGVNSELRQKGKIAVLACGYNGSVGALKAMGALKMGLSEDELQPIVDAWRQANPNIVQLWHKVDNAATRAISTGRPLTLRNLGFEKKSGILFITLPSGRRLAYVKPGIGVNRFGGTSITYWGQGVARKWQKLETYGGKLVENIVQATARDLLAEAITRIENAGHQIVMHIHDEVVIDEPINSGTTVADICALMNELPQWAEGLPIDAAGYECGFYQKD